MVHIKDVFLWVCCNLESKEPGAKVDTRLSKVYEVDRRRIQANKNEESVSSGYPHRDSGSIRSLRALLGKERYYPVSRKVRLILFINLVTLTVLAGLNFFFSNKSLQRVQKGMELANLSNLRFPNVLRAEKIGKAFLEASFVQDISLWGAYSNQTLTRGSCRYFCCNRPNCGKAKVYCKNRSSLECPR